jgi:GDPmannose 4,6-dehydratase
MEEYVRTDASLLRPAEVELLLGDPRKAHKALNWKPQVSLEELAAEMVAADIKRHSR